MEDYTYEITMIKKLTIVFLAFAFTLISYRAVDYFWYTRKTRILSSRPTMILIVITRKE